MIPDSTFAVFEVSSLMLLLMLSAQIGLCTIRSMFARTTRQAPAGHANPLPVLDADDRRGGFVPVIHHLEYYFQ